MEHTSTSKHYNSYHNILAFVSTWNSLDGRDVKSKVSINIYLLKAAAVVLSESTYSLCQMLGERSLVCHGITLNSENKLYSLDISY